MGRNEEFQTLRRVLANDGEGIQSDGLSQGCGLTALIQPYAQGDLKLSGLDDDDLEALASSEAIPRRPGKGGSVMGLKGPSHAGVEVSVPGRPLRGVVATDRSWKINSSSIRNPRSEWRTSSGCDRV